MWDDTSFEITTLSDTYKKYISPPDDMYIHSPFISTSPGMYDIKALSDEYFKSGIIQWKDERLNMNLIKNLKTLR